MGRLLDFEGSCPDHHPGSGLASGVDWRHSLSNLEVQAGLAFDVSYVTGRSVMGERRWIRIQDLEWSIYETQQCVYQNHPSRCKM